MKLNNTDKKTRIQWTSSALTLSTLGVIVALSGCATTGDPSKSERITELDAALPQNWNQPTQNDAVRSIDFELSKWWEQFNDPTLHQLINTALNNNLDLRKAVLNIEQARIQKGLAEAQKLPSVSASTSLSGSRVDYLDSDGHVNSDSASASLSASWEPDVFGKQRLAISSAESGLMATMEDFYGVQVSLSAEVASTYLNLRLLQSEMDILEQTLKMREQTLEITRWQEEAGEVNALEVQQAIVSYEQAKTSLPSLRQSIEETLNTLSLLCGEQPGSLRRLMNSAVLIPAVPANIAVAIPAETLAQRPDIKAQRHRIEAAVADLTAAEKERLPSLSLSGSIGLSEGRLSDLLDPTQVVTSLVGRLTAPFWDAGRISRQIELQDVSLQKEYLSYESLLLNALNDVETSVSSITNSHERIGLVQTATEAARESANLAELQYEAGEVDLLSVLDSQRSLLSLEQSLISAKVQELNAHISLYKAMGGGWSAIEVESPVDDRG